MAALPKSKADVFFGDLTTPLPDWRKELPADDSDEDEPSEEELKAVVSILGFDPSEPPDSSP